MKNLFTTAIAMSIVASSAVVYAAPSGSRAVLKTKMTRVAKASKAKPSATTTASGRPIRLRPQVSTPTEDAPVITPVVNRCKELDMDGDKRITSSDRDLFVKGLTHIINKTLDYNNDHYVNVLDIVGFNAKTRAVTDAFTSKVRQCSAMNVRYDADGNGELNEADLILLRRQGRLNRRMYNAIKPCIEGAYDYNGDETTNILDIVNFIQDQMLEQQAFTTAVMSWAQGEAHDIYDINNDDNLNVADAVLYIRHYLTCTAGL